MSKQRKITNKKIQKRPLKMHTKIKAQTSTSFTPSGSTLANWFQATFAWSQSEQSLTVNNIREGVLSAIWSWAVKTPTRDESSNSGIMATDGVIYYLVIDWEKCNVLKVYLVCIFRKNHRTPCTLYRFHQHAVMFFNDYFKREIIEEQS